MAVLKAQPKSTDELQACLDKTGTGKPYSELRLSGSTLITRQVFLNPGTRIICAPGTIWKLGANAPLGVQVPIVGQRGSTISGLYVKGLTVDGNYLQQTRTPDDHGKGYGNAFGFSGISNSTFENVTVQNSEGDGFRIYKGSGLKVINCKGAKYGHDFIHLNVCSQIDITGCTVTARTNNAVRIRGSHDVRVTGNTFTGAFDSYAPLIQIEQIEAGSQYNILVEGNTIQKALGPGINILGTTSTQRDITIRNNRILNCGLMPKSNRLSNVGGIVFDGCTNLVIQGNTVTGCCGYGIAYADYLTSFRGRGGYTGVITGNTVTGTRPANYPGVASGTAIYAKDKLGYRLTVSGNKLSGNVRDYYNVAG